MYWVDVATFVVSFISVAFQRSQPALDGAARAGWKSVVEGFRYLRGRQVIQGVYLLDIDAMASVCPEPCFRHLTNYFQGGAQAVGFFVCVAWRRYSDRGSNATGWVKAVRRQGLAVIVAVTIWGVAITVFGLADVLWVAWRCSPWPVGPMSCRPSSAPRFSRPPYQTLFAAVFRRSR